MHSIDIAKSAISNSNFELFEEILMDLSKEQIQELAFFYKATSVTINMSGTWVEICRAKLLNSSGKVVLDDIRLERGYKGRLEQFYDSSALHLAALAVLDANFTADFDEDYFSAGEMLFGKECGFGASSSAFEAECKSEERIYNELDVDDEDFDPDDTEVDENGSSLIIQSVYIVPNRLIILIEGHPPISIKVYKDISHLVLWFVFALLFNSSGKSLNDLDKDSAIISDFMDDNFQISV